MKCCEYGSWCERFNVNLKSHLGCNNEQWVFLICLLSLPSIYLNGLLRQSQISSHHFRCSNLIEGWLKVRLGIQRHFLRTSYQCIYIYVSVCVCQILLWPVRTSYQCIYICDLTVSDAPNCGVTFMIVLGHIYITGVIHDDHHHIYYSV